MEYRKENTQRKKNYFINKFKTILNKAKFSDMLHNAKNSWIFSSLIIWYSHIWNSLNYNLNDRQNQRDSHIKSHKREGRSCQKLYLTTLFQVISSRTRKKIILVTAQSKNVNSWHIGFWTRSDQKESTSLISITPAFVEDETFNQRFSFRKNYWQRSLRLSQALQVGKEWITCCSEKT